MKRSLYIGLTLLYNYFVTLICYDLAISTSGNVLVDIPQELGLLSALDTFTVFGELLAFNITGIPASIIFIFIYIPNIILLVLILSWILNREG